MFMKKLPIIALIGQTNAGKSSLLNRMAHKNIAIVAREEGTTRDNVVATIDNAFILVDTAGLKDPSDDFEASIQEQIQDAIESADIILVTLDSSKYFDHRDRKIAKDALRSGKPVFLVLNKCDLGESLPIEEFRALGIAPECIYYTSATTGQGIEKLKGMILDGIAGFCSSKGVRRLASRGVAPAARGDGPAGRAPRGAGLDTSEDEIPTISLSKDALKTTWKVTKTEDDKFVVTGEKIEKFARRTDLNNYASVNRLRDILKKMGIRAELTSQGAKPDSIVSIAGKEFTLVEDW